MDKPDWYLIAYDIAEPRRLQRLHRRLRRDGLAMQESVFLVQCNQGGIGTLMDELAALIHRREDDLRAYPIQGPDEIWLRGHHATDGSLLRLGHHGGTPEHPVSRRVWWRRLLGE